MTQNDEFVQKALTALKQSGPLPIRSKLDDWELENGLLFFKQKCYVPPGDLRKTLTKRYHDSLTAGHPGQLKTLELLRRNYYWPGMTVFVRNYVDGCATCQQMKINTHPTKPGLMPIKTPVNATPFSDVTCDFITDLPESDGFDSLMVVVDHGSSKGVIISPTNKTIDAIGTTQLYFDGPFR
jgi:hypothetical protein